MSSCGEINIMQQRRSIFVLPEQTTRVAQRRAQSAGYYKTEQYKPNTI